MPTPISMPKLGMTMSEGRVVDWPLPVGSHVEKGERVLVIESEKTEIEVEAPASGVLRHVYVDVDSTVPCGALLAVLTDTAEEDFDADEFRHQHDAPAPAAAATQTHTGRAPLRSPTASSPGAAPATPAARALARQLGVDLGSVSGSGPGGRVTKEDVEAAAANRGTAASADRVPLATGVALEVPTQGDGEVVLLLPGFGTDVSVFAPQVRALAQRWKVRGVNPRGVGRSDAPPSGLYDVATAAADAAAVAAAPVHVVGASLGAAVALEMALSHPQQVRSLTLITPFVEASPRLVAVLESWCRLAREASAETLARALLPWFFSPASLADAAASERTVRGLAAVVARVPAPTLERSLAGLRAWSGTRRADLARLAVPTLVLVAGGDLLTPRGEEIAAAIPGAELVEVPGAGHALGLEAVEAVNEALSRHLERNRP